MDRKTAKDHLRKLQKKLIINCTSAQSFYTKFNERSSKIMDLSKINDYWIELLNGKKILIRPTDNAQSSVLINKLKKIIYSNNKKIKETGVDSLYIGWPYIVGSSNKEMDAPSATDIYRAPILLWKVTIEFPTQYTCSIRLENNDSVIHPYLNIGLLARVAVANKKSIDFFDYDDLEISYKNIDVNVLNNIFFEKLCKLYKEAGFNFDDEAMSILKEILLLRKCDEFHDQEVNKKTLTDQKKINFIKENIFAYACIGIYTHQNISIFHMYNKLINSNEGLDFYIDLSNKFSLTGEDGDICDDECKLLQITKLDYSQRQAIIKAMNSDLVIQGPPGTGKSQTITNIIANAIHDNKKVLFITEKYVAAQVVDKRLNKLNKFSLPLYDVQGNKNKEEFYSKIKKIYSPKLNCYHENISTEIKRLFEKMEQYEENARSDDAKEYLQFLKCYRKNIAIYERWKESLSGVKKFENSQDFWKYIDQHTENRKWYQYFSALIFKYHISINDLNFTQNVFHENIDTGNIQNIAYFKRKGKIKNSYNFFNKLKNKKIIRNEPNLFKFLNDISIHEKVDIKERFNQQQYVDFQKNINKHETKTLTVFCDKYNQTNFSFNEYQLYLRYLKFVNEKTDFLNFDKTKIRKDIAKLFGLKEKSDVNRIYNKLQENIWINAEHSHETLKGISDLINHSNNQRRRNITWVLDKYYKQIDISFPIIISNPDVAATLFKDHKFDYVIVDEASQVTLERALPILFLGKKCIISGDKQQLQPSDFFQSKLIEEYEETYSKDDDEYLENSLSEIEDSGSLLEFVEKKYINKMLNYHYRSSRRELIQFSNVVFYNGKLIIASEPKDNVPGIEVINVKGVWDGKTNQKEADEIVKLVKKIISKEKHGSIGIVTFNINQKDLIEDMINNSNDYKIENELNRKKENGEDDSLFVKNLENVQGDERDIIIFSVTYARDSSGIFRNAFGPINKPGGKNRINVAISRSKEKMYIFKSINSGLIQRQGNDGRQIFHDYIEYVELFEKKPDLESNEIKNLFSKYLNENENINISALENQFDSPFEEEVFMEISKKIDNKKFKVISQFKQSGYIIDLVIKNIKSGEFLLAIECDGHSYHYANMTQKERDYYRQKYLEDRGWKFYRIDSFDWYKHTDAEKLKIINEIISRIN